MDKDVTSTPIKREEKRVGVPEDVKGKEMEVLWPTEREVQEGELKKPQWERKQINVRQKEFVRICSTFSFLFQHIWYGYDFSDKFRDEVKMKQRMFALVSMGIFLFWFMWRYFPDRL